MVWKYWICLIGLAGILSAQNPISLPTIVIQPTPTNTDTGAACFAEMRANGTHKLCLTGPLAMSADSTLRFPASGTPGNCLGFSTATQLADVACGGVGSGISTLASESGSAQGGSAQSFASVDDTNILLAISSASNIHTWTITWTGTLAKSRQHPATVYTDQNNSYGSGTHNNFAGGDLTLPVANPFVPASYGRIGVNFVDNTLHVHLGSDKTIATIPINLATQVTGNLAVTNLNGGTGASSTTCWFGDGTWKTCGSGGAGNVSVTGATSVNNVPFWKTTGGELDNVGWTVYADPFVFGGAMNNSIARRNVNGDLYASWYRGSAVNTTIGVFTCLNPLGTSGCGGGIPTLHVRRDNDVFTGANIIELKRNDAASDLAVFDWNGNFSGRSATTLAFSSNPANCSAGNLPRGIAADGSCEGGAPVNLATEVTGNIGIGNFNNGTGASSTTCWFGDGTWKTCGGGGSSGDVTASGSPTITGNLAFWSNNAKQLNANGIAYTTLGTVGTIMLRGAASETFAYDKGAEKHNVKAYGATGNCSTDDTIALRAAIAAAESPTSSSRVVYFPRGCYAVQIQSAGDAAVLTNDTQTGTNRMVILEGEGYGEYIGRPGNSYILYTGSNPASLKPIMYFKGGDRGYGGGIRNLSIIPNSHSNVRALQNEHIFKAAFEDFTVIKQAGTHAIDHVSQYALSQYACYSTFRNVGILDPATNGSGILFDGGANGDACSNMGYQIEASYDDTGFDISSIANNGSGLMRVVTSTAHGFYTNQVVTARNTTGCTFAIAAWQVTVINSTTVDLQGSLYSGCSYTSGGKIGGGFGIKFRGADNNRIYGFNSQTTGSASSGVIPTSVWTGCAIMFEPFTPNTIFPQENTIVDMAAATGFCGKTGASALANAINGVYECGVNCYPGADNNMIAGGVPLSVTNDNVQVVGGRNYNQEFANSSLDDTQANLVIHNTSGAQNGTGVIDFRKLDFTGFRMRGHISDGMKFYTYNTGTLTLDFSQHFTQDAKFGTKTLGSATSNTLCYSPFGGINYLSTCSSLSKYKLNQQTLVEGLPLALALRPISYFSTTSNRAEIGLLAEEVEKLDSRLSEYDGKGNLTGVNYGHVVSVALKAIQELNEKIKLLEAKVNQ